MFYDMRRKDKQTSKKEAEKILMNGEYGVFSTIGENGYPYGVPVSYIYRNGNIYFHGANTGHKFDNLLFSHKVCFTVVNNVIVSKKELVTNFDSVIIFGKGAILPFSEEKNEIFYALTEKYCPHLMDMAKEDIQKSGKVSHIIKIDIEDIKGKVRYQE